MEEIQADTSDTNSRGQREMVPVRKKGTFSNLDVDCKLEILKQLDSFHDLQVLIEACPGLYPLLCGNLLGIYRRILANSFQLDPWDLVYQAAGSPPIIENVDEWKERRKEKVLRYTWHSFTREYANDSRDTCLWLLESSDDEYQTPSVSGFDDDGESSWDGSDGDTEEEGDDGHMTDPEGKDQEEGENNGEPELEPESSNGEDARAQDSENVGGDATQHEASAAGEAEPPVPKLQVGGNAIEHQAALSAEHTDETQSQKAGKDGGATKEEEEEANGNGASEKTNKKGNDGDNEKHGDDEIASEAGEWCGYADPEDMKSSYRKQPPRFPIPKVKTSTLFELSHINHFPMRIFQVYRKYMLPDPLANPGAKEGFYRHIPASRNELYKFKRGFLMFYIYRNMWRTAHGISYKNLSKVSTYGISSSSLSAHSISDSEADDKDKQKDEEETEKDAIKKAAEHASREELLLRFLRSASQRDLSYLVCVTRIIIRMTELLAREMNWKDSPKPYRLIDTIFESETASGYSSLTRVLDQFHNARPRRIHKLLQSVNAYYDTLMPQFLAHLLKVFLEKGGTKATYAESEAEGIWDKNTTGDSLWLEGSLHGEPRNNKSLWIGDLPQYYNDDHYQGHQNYFI